jgi:xylan 1,4-beta-xylosidase
MSKYRNPIIRGVNPDPSVCRVGEDYYLATSAIGLYPVVPIYHSRDLVNWRQIGHCLTRREQLQLDRTTVDPIVYAPTLRYHDGVFYMITTNIRAEGNFYVTATDPAGPWSDPIYVDNEAFDPSLLFDDDGKVYYTRRGLFKDRDIVQAEIDIKTGRLLTPMRSISLGMESDDAEGPHLYKIDGWYYLMLAEGGTRYLHKETIGRSRSPWGPFDPCPHNPIVSQFRGWNHLVKCTGHGDLIQAHDGSWWIVFLGTRQASTRDFGAIGRETFLASVEWRDGWPIVDTQAMREFEVEAATLPAHPWPAEPGRDDFDEDRLRLSWVSLSYPKPGIFSLTERPGFLRLWGQATGFSENQQAAFVATRQKDLRAEVEALLEFNPSNEREAAGLSVLQSKSFHFDLMLTIREGRRSLVIRKAVGDIVHEEPAIAAPEGPIAMKIAVEAELCVFSFKGQDGAWVEAGSALPRLISPDVVTGWGGCVIGMFSCGTGEPCRAPADFDWFEYRGLDS